LASNFPFIGGAKTASSYTLDEIKEQFWALMRWNYDQTISTYLEDKEDIEKKIGDMTIKKQEAQDGWLQTFLL
jgi:hypothetical protein